MHRDRRDERASAEDRARPEDHVRDRVALLEVVETAVEHAVEIGVVRADPLEIHPEASEAHLRALVRAERNVALRIERASGSIGEVLVLRRRGGSKGEAEGEGDCPHRAERATTRPTREIHDHWRS